jgi:hypothetical protein
MLIKQELDVSYAELNSSSYKSSSFALTFIKLHQAGQ